MRRKRSHYEMIINKKTTPIMDINLLRINILPWQSFPLSDRMYNITKKILYLSLTFWIISLHIITTTYKNSTFQNFVGYNFWHILKWGWWRYIEFGNTWVVTYQLFCRKASDFMRIKGAHLLYLRSFFLSVFFLHF